MRTTKIFAAVAAVAISGALIAGCSDDSSNSSPENNSSDSSTGSSAQFNDADVEFARMMYPHHAQAIEMTSMVSERSTNPDVIALAAQIADAQQPEMDQMTTWLDEWNQPTGPGNMGDGDHMGDPGNMGDGDHMGDPGNMGDHMGDPGNMGQHSGSGMMTAQDMDLLQKLEGADFDRTWLTMMIEHHVGAVDMAKTEIADGSNADAIAMATSIVDSQNAEIEQMQKLLG